MENRAFLSLGSNMGDRYQHLQAAVQLLDGHPSIKMVNYSSVYETDPVGYEDQDLFLNMVIEINTDLPPFELLEVCLKNEFLLGRKREIKWGPRTIDLDILLYNQENIETEKLYIPHSRMAERAFVLVPLYEVAGNIHLPGNREPLALLINRLPDKEGVRIWKRKNGEDGFGHSGN
ncbi:2-amino-4-hydroxy-6-hydroxymethyldihydropteridine diphosphokinase [Neobacillus notoginsengisoli]|uniref:2-amino-4-hydroxy-6-hydroxymethyldihydropteridine diphosphokinase n=1 Tax=Neobacillus notoginsengisoli TaxID=1578198 RepID=A0A417YGF8_9BACI|nr:2-amino-4-hydroxy-6-hydroxymethyldihydropteridine diphosphokinase [Neobacillus notoginsengisoli]RHW31832.1 2-amino-4-hydroxy-6-hydroxymethyldihydropteridine diphosphokinase [Neobacillus notoginsengisoli]